MPNRSRKDRAYISSGYFVRVDGQPGEEFRSGSHWFKEAAVSYAQEYDTDAIKIDSRRIVVVNVYGLSERFSVSRRTYDASPC